MSEISSTDQWLAGYDAGFVAGREARQLELIPLEVVPGTELLGYLAKHQQTIFITERDLLNPHARVRNFDKICPHCNRAFESNYKLERHVRTHTGEKPFECDLCHKNFTQVTSLQNHRRRHFKKYQPTLHVEKLTCPHCSYTCKTQKGISRHSRIHSPDNMCVCNVCGYRYANKSSLRMHVLSHNIEAKLHEN